MLSPVVRVVQSALEHVAVDLDDHASAVVRQWWVDTYGREPEASPKAVDLRRRITHLVRNVLQGVVNATLVETISGDTMLAPLPRRPPRIAGTSGARRA